MAFARRIIGKTLDLLNLQRHNDNYAEIETDLTNHESRITGAQSDITTHKASDAAHPAEHVTYSGAVVGATNIKEGLDSVKDTLDNVIVGGGDGTQAAAAAVSVTGTIYTTLKERVDTEYLETDEKFTTVSEQLADTSQMLPVNIITLGGVGDGSTDTLTSFNKALKTLDADISARITNRALTADGNSDGIADGWTTYTDSAITGTLSVSGGQVATVTASTGAGGRAVYQDIPVTPGEIIKFDVTYNSTMSTGDFGPAIVLQARNDAGSLISIVAALYPSNSATDTLYHTLSYIVPAGTAKIRLNLMAYAKAAGATGSATFKGVSMWRSSTNTFSTIKFPQNATGDAVYYFSAVPNLSALQIDADPGVTFSFPTTNGKTFDEVIFLEDVLIYSRDRDNIGIQRANNASDYVFNSLTDNDLDIGYKKLTVVADAAVQKKIYIANGTLVNDATLSYDSDSGMYSMASSGDIPHAVNKITSVETDFTVNNMYLCDYQFTTVETNTNVAVGITATTAGGDWLLYGIKADGTTAGLRNVSSVFSNFTTRSIQALLNDAYLLKTGIIMSARPIGGNKIEMYLNGWYIETVTVPFAFTKIGFGMLNVNAAGQGLQNTQWGRLLTGVCLKSNFGGPLTLAAFGDSISFGEGTFSWVRHLVRVLTGQKGITRVNITNYAASGNTTTQQLARIQAANLTGVDIVLILIGTNDIQGQMALATFRANVQAMITAANGSTNRKVVIGLPPMWISKTLTGTGATTSNYDKGAAYRSIIMHLAAINDIYVADTLSEIGRIGADNHKDTLRDNLHPNEQGQIALARCFERSILAAVTA